MRSLIYTAITIILLIIVFTLFSDNDSSSNFGDRIRATPCQNPITITVGNIDNRFGISESDVIATIKNVTETWSGVADRPVAIYSDNGKIKVNLVYDAQQQLTDRERQFRNRLQMMEYQITAFENDYLVSVESFDEWNDEYQRDSEMVQQMMNQLNNWIDQINSQGGFNSEQLETLEERRERINRLSDRLEQSGTLLTEKVDEINAQLSELNRMIEEKNVLIDEYNRTFSGTKRFTQGSYEYSDGNEWINIFQFANREELELVIAHEVGHALGLDHVENPASVMHHLMGQQVKTDLILTSEDQDALRDICDF